MNLPQFDSTGRDPHTYAPFILLNALDTQWKDVRLTFHDWDWLKQTHDTDTLGNYYFNGYGLDGLVMACRLSAGLDPQPHTIYYNSEGGACYIHFTDLAEAIQTAELAAAMLQDREKLIAMIAVAQENGFDDG
jgi:hypothetical protein